MRPPLLPSPSSVPKVLGKAVCTLWACMAGAACMAQATPAVELAGLDLPALVQGAQQVSGRGCPAVRARTPAALERPWRSVVTAITMRCTALEGPDKKPDARTEAIATLRPGAAVLRGVPVVALRHSASWAHDDQQYVLAAAYADVAPTLAPYVKARCLSQANASDAVEGLCTAVHEEGGQGFFMRTSELGGFWLRPDPDDPRRTMLVEAWSE